MFARNYKFNIKGNKTVLLHSLVGVIIGYFLLHPASMVIHWFEINDSLNLKPHLADSAKYYYNKVIRSASLNDEILDLQTCKNISNYKRELNMKEGWLSRCFTATLQNDIQVEVETKRFLSLDLEELGAIAYHITPLNGNAEIQFQPYLDAGITNEDTNWDDKFWDTLKVNHENNQAFIEAKTMKTDFYVCTFMESKIFLNKEDLFATI